MDRKTKKTKPVTARSDKNEGSGAFNQGSKQDRSFEKILTIADGEKRTGHRSIVSGKKKA
jgi:hypothetical protein